MDTLYSSEAFAGIRSMVPFRLTGQGKGEQISDARSVLFVLGIDERARYRRLPNYRVGLRELGDRRIPLDAVAEVRGAAQRAVWEEWSKEDGTRAMARSGPERP